MNNELKKNAEGYTDPTAAAMLIQKDTGDIWEYKGGECLIIKGHAGYATILRLHDGNQYGDRIFATQLHDGPRYVDPAFVITGRYTEMGSYLGTLEAEDLKVIVDAVIDAMGVKSACTGKANAQEVDKLREEVVRLQEEMAKLLDDLKLMTELRIMESDRANESDRATQKARNQLELLRDMYNELLARVVEG
jgi:hypothetical protein